MIQEQILSDIKHAMKARDTVRLEVLRGIKTAFVNELVATKRTPQDTLSDEEAVGVLMRLAKQRIRLQRPHRRRPDERLAGLARLAARPAPPTPRLPRGPFVQRTAGPLCILQGAAASRCSVRIWVSRSGGAPAGSSRVAIPISGRITSIR